MGAVEVIVAVKVDFFREIFSSPSLPPPSWSDSGVCALDLYYGGESISRSGGSKPAVMGQSTEPAIIEQLN